MMEGTAKRPENETHSRAERTGWILGWGHRRAIFKSHPRYSKSSLLADLLHMVLTKHSKKIKIMKNKSNFKNRDFEFWCAHYTAQWIAKKLSVSPSLSSVAFKSLCDLLSVSLPNFVETCFSKKKMAPGSRVS
jgi:hypothetical protein